MKNTPIAVALSVLLLATACKKDEATTHPQTYQLVTDSSTARWKGFQRTGYFNEGSLRVEGKDIRVENGMVTGGTFQMPLSSLVNFNLPLDSLKHLLIHHLQSPDFFNMALHPNLTYEIKRTEKYSGKDTTAIAGANYTVYGNLTMLGKPLEVTFPARITLTDKRMQVAAKVVVDRTRWGMNYAADPALPDDKYILPNMQIELALQGERK